MSNFNLLSFNKLIGEFNDLNYNSFIIADNCFPIDKIHIQKKVLFISNKEYEFVCIKNIIINFNYRGKGFFKNKILNCLVNLNLNIFIDDIVNDNFYHFLIKENFIPLNYTKNQDTIRAAYLLK